MRRSLLLVPLLLTVLAPARAETLHGLGFTYDFASITSKVPSSYSFHAPAFTWTMSGAEPSGWAAQVSLLIPAQARQDGAIYAATRFYKRFWGLDALVGRAWRFPLTERLELEGGGGAHLNTLALTAIDGYRDWTSLTAGLGGSGLVRYRTTGAFFARPLSVSAFSSLSVDFLDLLRGGDLRWGVHFAAGVQLAVALD